MKPPVDVKSPGGLLLYIPTKKRVYCNIKTAIFYRDILIGAFNYNTPSIIKGLISYKV